MDHGETLAYLAGLIDGDGYFKMSRQFRTAGTIHPYYATVVGVAQLWPSEAVKLFASSFGGAVKALHRIPGGRTMARCEIRGAKAESVARRLLPFLLLKRSQALFMLEVARLRPHRHGRAVFQEAVYDQIEEVRLALSSLQDGSWRSESSLPIPTGVRGYRGLSPSELGWSRDQRHAYLAGIIDSDGNLRVQRKRVKGMLGPHYRINIRCSQVMPSAAIELLASTFGGRINIRKSTRPNHRDMVFWSLEDKSAASAVEALLPYLRVKWLEALLLLELRGLKNQGKKGLTVWRNRTRWQRLIRMRKRCFTPDQVAEFERIRRNVLALHAGLFVERLDALI